MIDSKNTIDIGSRREVFWDDYLLDENFPEICEFSRAEIRQEAPQKREIVLRLDRDWEGKVCGYFHYFRDGRRYRFYYRASDGFSKNEQTGGLSKKACICVLLSDDGVHWERPDLGLVEFNNSTHNNIVFRADELDNFFVFKDENPACPPDQQYKAISQGTKTGALPNGGLWAYVSPDGFSWKPFSPQPIIRQGYFDTLNTAHWDKQIRKYRLYFRGFHGEEAGPSSPSGGNTGRGRYRDIRLMTSGDFLNWDDEKLLCYSSVMGSAGNTAAFPEEHLYTNGILPYCRAPHIHVGFPVRYTERKWEPMFDQLPHKQWRTEKMKRFGEPRLGTALTDGLFMMSRDGVNFIRYDEPFLKPGLFSKNNWVYGDCYQGCGLLELPDWESADGTSAELSYSNTEINFFAGEDYTSQPVAIRRFTIRPDGFACLFAGRREKQVLTKPFIFAGNLLMLNVSTSPAGFVMTEFLEPDGRGVPGFSGESGYRMFGDSPALRVIFRRGDSSSGDLSFLEGRPVRIRFTLRETKLYSMRFIKE